MERDLIELGIRLHFSVWACHPVAWFLPNPSQWAGTMPVGEPGQEGDNSGHPVALWKSPGTLAEAETLH